MIQFVISVIKCLPKVVTNLARSQGRDPRLTDLARAGYTTGYNTGYRGEVEEILSRSDTQVGEVGEVGAGSSYYWPGTLVTPVEAPQRWPRGALSDRAVFLR